MKHSVKATLAIAAIIITPSLASASILAQETFAGYTLAPLNGQGVAGGGWGGAWGAPGNNTRADVVNPSLGNNALEVQLSGGTANQITGSRPLASSVSQTFYVGYLWSVVTSTMNGTNSDWAGGNNTFGLHLGTNSSSTTTLNFGSRGGVTDEFMVRYGTGTPVLGAVTGGQVVNDTDYYLVAQVNWDSGLLAYTSAKMWVNPTGTDNVDTPAGDASLDFTDFANPITHIFWRQAALQNDDILRADNLILGTTWDDVVIPEPSTFALAGLGGLLLLRAARRRG